MMKSCILSFTLLTGAVLSIGATARAEPSVTITDLQTLSAPFSESSMGGRINNFGQVIFQSYGKGDYAFGHACLWTPAKRGGTSGTLTDLNPNANSKTTQCGGAGINDAGQVVGFTTPPPAYSLYVSGFYWTPTVPDKRTSGNLTLITSTQGNPGEIHVWALNNPTGDHGPQAVGNGPLRSGSLLSRRPLLWVNGNPNDLGVLPGDVGGDANDINDSSEVVGYTFALAAFGSGPRHAALWKDGKVLPLGALPDDIESVAASINAAGQVTGNSFDSMRGSHAFLWVPNEPNGSEGALTGIGLLKDYTDTTAFAMNAKGQVVGRAFNGAKEVYPSGRAFLYDAAKGVKDLNSLLPPHSGWLLEAATSINDAGQIVGTGLYTDKAKKVSRRRAFLLTFGDHEDKEGQTAAR